MRFWSWGVSNLGNSLDNVENQNSKSLSCNYRLYVWQSCNKSYKTCNERNNCLKNILLVISHALICVINLILNQPAAHIKGVRVEKENCKLHQTNHHRISG